MNCEGIDGIGCSRRSEIDFKAPNRDRYNLCMQHYIEMTSNFMELEVERYGWLEQPRIVVNAESKLGEPLKVVINVSQAECETILKLSVRDAVKLCNLVLDAAGIARKLEANK